jgi:hypothetical protein
MFQKIINKIPRAKSTATVKNLVDKSADAARKISQSGFIGRAAGYLDEALLGREAAKLISAQDSLADYLSVLPVRKAYVEEIGKGMINASLRGAGIGAVTGGLYGASDPNDNTSVLRGAMDGAVRGAGAGLLYSTLRSQHLLSKL